MNRYQTQARLACQISIGLMAGVFSIVPVVEASPVQDAASAYNKGGVTVVPGPVTKVTSTTQNNIVAWKDFSVAQGETVQFDGGSKGSKANNYLNVVTGNATSEIAGKIEGGNDVYLVNPHGVIFSKTAQVDVGNLYVSTQDFKSAVDAYTGGKAGGAVLQAGTAQADIVNLGRIAADKVEADGTHIRFLNSAAVTAKSGVVLNAAGDDAYVHVGNAGGTDAGYTSTKGTPIDYYQLVSNVTGLQNIENDLGKNYMLSEDIDASGIDFTPLGDSTTSFSGKFDGMFHEIRNLTVNTRNNAGLFGDIKGTSNQKARVENLGLVGAKITSSRGYAGAIAGNADYALIQNVYSEAGTSGAISGRRAGGILGNAGGAARQSDTITIRRAYNTVNAIGGGSSSGGIVGVSGYGTNIEDVYSTNTSTDSSFYGITRLSISGGGVGTPTVKRVYAPQAKLTTDDTIVTNSLSGISGLSATDKTLSTYTAAGWGKDTDISNDGTKNTTWRIYEGQGTPLLTAFLKGTVTASYRYNYFTNPTDQAATTDGLALAGVTGTTDGSDINATYNAQYFKIADSTGKKAGTVSDITFSGGVKAGDNDVVIDSRVSGSGIRNVSDSPGAFLSSTQHGYNIVGGNLNIAQREVNVTGGTYHITREYDGTDDATSALLAAMNSSSSGYQVTGLLANDTVKLTGITATYQGNSANGRAAKDADTGKSVTVNASGIGLKDTKNNGAEKNYKLNTSSLRSFSVKGDITPRTLYLTVKNSGFTKTYDGNTSITDTNAAPSTNLTIDATKGTAHQLATVTSTSGGTTSSTTDTITYDTSKTTVEYADKNAGQNKNIYYKNISLTGANAYNYTLLAENAQSATGYDVLYDATTGQASSSAVLTTAGNIDPRVIDPTKFSVKDAQGNVSPSGTKPYDGEAAFDSTGYTLVAPSAAATGNTGIISGENITFSIVPGKANFLDASGNQTSQVNDATKIGYNIKATAGADTNTGGTTVLSNYIWGTGGSALDASKEYQVTTAGSITPRDLSFTVTQPTTVSIDKEYNGGTALDTSSPYYTAATTFGSNGYVDYASGSKPIVTDRVNGGTPTLTVTAVYDNKNVNRKSVTQPAGARGIDYTVTLGGANAANYTINGQSVTSYTMKGSATGAKGIITPKDLTLSLQNPTKVYDGDTTLPTKYLPSGTPAGVYAGDSVQYGTSATGAYHSKNVNGDGTTWTDVSGQVWKNWVDYSNLSLTGNDALNYDIAQTATVGGTITPLALAASDFSYTYHTISKEYDGKTDVSSADALNGLATVRVTSTGDEFKNASVNHTKNLTASYANPNSQNQTLQNVTYGFTILDDQSGNYTLPASGISVTTTAANAGRITPRKVVAAATDNNLTKTYDATAAAQAVNGQSLVSYTYFDQSSGQPSTAKPALVGTDADASTGAYQDSSAGANDAADAGTGKTVLYTPSISTGDTSNYEVVDAQGNALRNHQLVSQGTGTIDKAPLTIGFGRVEKTYDAKADVTTTGSTTNGDITTITPKLSGFVKGETASFDNKATAKIQGYYTDWDGKTGMPSPDANVNLDSSTRTVKDKAVYYTGIDTAFADLASRNAVLKNYEIAGAEQGAQFLSAGTSGVKDTVYFAERLGKGRIKQLSLAQGQIKENWTLPITKEYDTTDKVLEPEKHFALYTDVTGTQIPIGYDLASAVYDNQRVDQTNGKEVGVTYTINGISQQSLGNFIIDAATQQAYQNKQYKAKGVITPKKIYAKLRNTQDIRKIYDGTADADVKNLVFYDAQEHPLSDDGIYAKDRPQVNTAVVAAYSDKTAGDKTATIDPGAAATDAKTVTYTLSLSDTTGKGNYVLDDQIGSPKTASAQQNIYEGKGDIERRKLFVDFANGQPTGLDKPYDGSDTVDVSKIAGYPHIFATLPEDAQAQTGVVTVQGTKDDAEVDDASVQAAYQSRHVARDASGAPTTQDVYFWNFQLKGNDKDNYIVVANPQSQYARVVTKNGAAQQALAGSGTIHPDQVTVSLKDKNVQKEYDGTTAVVDYTDAGGTAHTYLTDNLQWNDAPIVGRGDKLVTKWVQAPAFASKNVKGTDGQGMNPVTYAFTWSNDSADGTGYHDYDVVIAPHDGQVTGQGAGATAALTATGVITPRVLTVTGAADATKVYDTTPDLVGGDAGKNLTFARKDGSTNVFGQGDTINDLLAQAEAKYQETAQGKGDAADATAGVAADGTSLPLLQHDVVYTNITLGNSNYALDPTSPQTVPGTGTITRATIKMTAAPVSITEGSTLPASYRGAETGWQGMDGWLGTDGANVRYAPEDGQTSRTAGSYPIWAWYRTGQDAQGNDIFTKVAQRPYDRNYVLEQDPANATALAITARHHGGGGGGGFTPPVGPVKPVDPGKPVDPVTPVDPGKPVDPEKPVQPVVPPVNVPADIEQATAMAKKFTPDRRAYNHASHDEMNSVVREPQAGLAYADGGVNAGHVVTSAGGDVSHSMMDVQGQGEVVNLTGGDAAQGAMRDVTRHGKSFTLTGSLAAYGLSEEAAAQLQAQAGTSGPEETAIVGIKGGNVNVAEGQPQGNLLGTKGGDSSRGISGSEPVVQQSGGNSAASAALFHDASEGYPGHLAATEDAHLFDDAVPAVTAAGEAHVSLFDDSSETAGREHSSHDASGAAVSLFGDEPAAQPASGAGISASGAVKAQTSSADEEDEKEKEEAAHAAALKAKGADIGIESEGAGVNLAG